MSFYWVSTGSFIKALFSKYVWAIPNQENKIFLTFDDGPIPEITEWVLEELKKYDAKATFFCIGNNIEKNPAIFNKILADGHAIGNHTFNHRNGWKSSLEDYIEEVRLCDLQIKAHTPKGGLLFRPPYGKLKPAQAMELRKKGYKIIMWEVLSADFDHSISPQKCLKNVISNTTSGSVVVFHDSIKGYENLKYTLPIALKYWHQKGYQFEGITKLNL
jgi:peptidoglycan/xylan/chitin deacetylase (PgdA/CDA1 family)